MASRTSPAKRKKSTAETILDSAERLCAMHGIEAVSVRDIAAEAGVSIPVIYHHYKSKSNLLRAIVYARFTEIAGDYRNIVASLEAQESPAVRDIVTAVLKPLNLWRKPGREASLQFHALALVSPQPEVRYALDAGVPEFHRVIALLRRALPHLTHEDICWRLHFTIKISQETALDAARLGLLSKGMCNSDDPEEALARAIAYAEAAFLAPPVTYSQQAAPQPRAKRRRPSQ